MLTDLLNIIYDIRFYSKSYIAKELDITEDFVQDLMDQLLTMGYLKEDEKTTCTSGCKSCPLASSCSKDIMKTYTLTDKGLKAIK